MSENLSYRTRITYSQDMLKKGHISVNSMHEHVISLPGKPRACLRNDRDHDARLRFISARLCGGMQKSYVMPMPVIMIVTMAVPMMVVTRGIHSPQVYCQSTGADHEKLFHVHDLWRICSEGKCL